MSIIKLHILFLNLCQSGKSKLNYKIDNENVKKVSIKPANDFSLYREMTFAA